MQGRLPAGMRFATLRLDINGRYTFYAPLEHDINIAWQWHQPPTKPHTMEVTSAEGRYDSSTKSGKISIAGTLPNELTTFGDMSFETNGQEIVLPLLSLDNFELAMQTGGTLKYAKNGLIVVVNLSEKTWSVSFNNKAFQELLAPSLGTIRQQVKVGGITWYNAELSIVDFIANVSLGK